MELSLAAEELHRRCPLAASSPIGPCARTCACIATHHVQQVRWHLQRSIRHSCHVFEGLHELGKGQRPGVCITSVPGDASTAWHCHSAYRQTKALDEFFAGCSYPTPLHTEALNVLRALPSHSLYVRHTSCVSVSPACKMQARCGMRPSVGARPSMARMLLRVSQPGKAVHHASPHRRS